MDQLNEETTAAHVDKQAARVEVVKAQAFGKTERGPLSGIALRYGIKIELCGEADTEVRCGWDGYVYEHPVLGESLKAYEAADDCAKAAIIALRNSLFTEDEQRAIAEALYRRAERERAVAAAPGVLPVQVQAVQKTLLEQAERHEALAETFDY